MLESLEKLDRMIFLQINGSHGAVLDSVMWQLSESWHTYTFVSLVAFYVYKKVNLKRAVEFLMGIAIVIACSDLSANAVKYSVKRYRPTHNTEIQAQVHTVNDYRGGQYGFFSSHAANSFGITTFIFLGLAAFRKKWHPVIFVYPLLIGYSRIYLGVHYPLDILAGAMCGVFFALVIHQVMVKHFFSKHEKN
jgi:undecaprenyl-diphosphatase